MQCRREGLRGRGQGTRPKGLELEGWIQAGRGEDWMWSGRGVRRAEEWRGTEGHNRATRGPWSGRKTHTHPRDAAGPRQIHRINAMGLGYREPLPVGTAGTAQGDRESKRQSSASTTLAQRKEIGTLFPQAGSPRHTLQGKSGRVRSSPGEKYGARAQHSQKQTVSSGQVPVFKREPQNALFLDCSNTNDTLILLSGCKMSQLREAG